MFEIKECECAEIPHRTPIELMESLREHFRRGVSIVQAAFAHSFFLHPEEVDAPPLCGDRARYSREHYPDRKKGERADWKGREVRLDDNSAAQKTWERLSRCPLVRRSGYGVRHIWGEPWNPDMFTAGWNLCYMPFWAGMLTEEQHLYRDLREAVRQVAWELYFGDNGRLEVPDSLATIVNNPGMGEELNTLLDGEPILVLRGTQERHGKKSRVSVNASGDEVLQEQLMKQIRGESRSSWLNLIKAVLDLQGKPHKPFSTNNVAASSKSTMRRIQRETKLELAEIERFLKQIATPLSWQKSVNPGNMNAYLDLDFVRGCFPAFAEPLPAKTAFFENAGGSYVAGAVLDRLAHFYRANKVQPYGASEICAAAGAQMDAGRRVIADLLGVAADTLTLGPSTTQNLNTLAHACTAIVSPGKRVIVSAQDHEANIGAWQRLCARNGAAFILWPVDPQSGELSLDDLRALLDERAAVVCVTQSSNIIGTLNPVAEVIALCRGYGARAIIDGVSAAPHQWPDIAKLQPDAYCFSAYKTYATHLGVMYVAADFAAALEPQCHYFNRGRMEKHFDAAGPDHASIAALAGLGDYFAASYRHHFGDDGDANDNTLAQQARAVSTVMHRHEAELCAPLLEALRGLPLRVIGRDCMDGREANIALVSERHSSARLSAALAEKDIAAGHGHFYAKRLLESAGVQDSEDGVLRISFAHYNTAEEVTRVIDALRELHA